MSFVCIISSHAIFSVSCSLKSEVITTVVSWHAFKMTSYIFIGIIFYLYNSEQNLLCCFSVFEGALSDHIPVVHASVAGCRIIGRLCAGMQWC